MKTLKSIFQTFYLIVFVMIITVFAINGCKNTDKESKGNDTIVADSLTDAEEEMVEEEVVEDIVYPMSTPLEITEMLNKAGASYIISVSNPVERIDSYMDRKSKAVNLGVYGADMSYASTYNKTQEVTLYLENVRKLSEDLGIANTYNESVLERVDNNLGNKDSLHTIFTNTFHTTYEKLNEEGKGATAVLVLAGGWVEGLYIACRLAEMAPNNEEILKGIAAQKVNFDKLLVAMEVHQENPDVQAILTKVSKLQDVYDKVKVTEITDEQFKQLSALITQIREDFVK